MIQFLDPVGNPNLPDTKLQREISTLSGKRVCLVWNQYASTRHFWPKFENAITTLYEPKDIHRIYKSNTWSPAPSTELTDAMTQSDYVVAGVGA